MKIAVVVHGRFHAFDLVRALLKRGHEITVFTNYPKWAAKRFGISPDRVRSFWPHGVLTRISGKIRALTGRSLDRWTHPMFGRWAARQLRREHWDVIHAWSGVAEEIYRDPGFDRTLKLVMRGSAHIREQDRILAEEQRRAARRIDRPTGWMIGREEREYALANRVIVLSGFAYDSFRSMGCRDSVLRLLPLGTNSRAFRPDPLVIEQRCARIVSGKQLRVLYVGNVSFQKGLADMRHVVKQLSDRFQFRFIGAVPSEAKAVVASIAHEAEFVKKRPQRELPQEYCWGDVFLFPTLQDGFAVVLAQASAAALPILTTTNCCGPDLIREGRTGWVLPIRSPEAFVNRLLWCNSHRRELADMVRAAYHDFKPRDWSEVAADFEAICEEKIAAQTAMKTPIRVLSMDPQ
jgi:glycosyltransferase involved in cell wall biosynthesis